MLSATSDQKDVAPGLSAKIVLESVSYTHLDVYKRQVMSRLTKIKHLTSASGLRGLSWDFHFEIPAKLSIDTSVRKILTGKAWIPRHGTEYYTSARLAALAGSLARDAAKALSLIHI